MRHFPFTDIVNWIADSDWGHEFETREAASQALMKDPTKLTAYALVELLKRMNAIAAASGESEKNSNDNKVHMPSNAKVFPGKQVGDRIWSGELDEGICEHIVIGKSEAGHCMIVDVGDFDLSYVPRGFIACDYHFATVEEAIEDAVNRDKKYHEPKLAFAKAALKALKGGKELDEFTNGLPEED